MHVLFHSFVDHNIPHLPDSCTFKILGCKYFQRVSGRNYINHLYLINKLSFGEKYFWFEHAFSSRCEKKSAAGIATTKIPKTIAATTTAAATSAMTTACKQLPQVYICCYSVACNRLLEKTKILCSAMPY